jgi:hypothetical protein
MPAPFSLRATLRAFAPALALAVAGLTVACADGPTAPRAPGAANAPRLEVVAPSVTADVLTRTVPIADTVVTVLHVDGNGGKYSVPGGLKIDVPAATFRDPITLTVRTLPGDMVAYEFEPHGLVFKKPLAMLQDLRGTNWAGKNTSAFEVGYFASGADLSWATKQAQVHEFLKSTVDTKGQRMAFDVFHFSGYLMSTGRK